MYTSRKSFGRFSGNSNDGRLHNRAYFLHIRFAACACMGLLALVAIITTVVLLTTGGEDHGYRDNDDSSYFPGETRIINDVFSDFICSFVELESAGFTPVTAVHLYSLLEPPVLGAGNTFTVVNTSSMPFSGYLSWFHYLHEESVISLNTCSTDSSSPPSSVLLIHGTDNYRDWTLYKSSWHVYKKYSLDGSCPTYTNVHFVVPDRLGGVWYVVLVNAHYSTVTFGIHLTFHATEYKINHNSVLYSCSIQNMSSVCMVPSSNEAIYLIEVGPPKENFSYTDTVTANVACVVNGGVLAGLVVGTLVVFIVVGIIITVIFCYCLRRKKKCNTVTVTVAPTTEMTPIVTDSSKAVATTLTLSSSSTQLLPDNQGHSRLNNYGTIK